MVSLANVNETETIGGIIFKVSSKTKSAEQAQPLPTPTQSWMNINYIEFECTLLQKTKTETEFIFSFSAHKFVWKKTKIKRRNGKIFRSTCQFVGGFSIVVRNDHPKQVTTAVRERENPFQFCRIIPLDLLSRWIVYGIEEFFSLLNPGKKELN